MEFLVTSKIEAKTKQEAALFVRQKLQSRTYDVICGNESLENYKINIMFKTKITKIIEHENVSEIRIGNDTIIVELKKMEDYIRDTKKMKVWRNRLVFSDTLLEEVINKTFNILKLD